MAPLACRPVALRAASARGCGAPAQQRAAACAVQRSPVAAAAARGAARTARPSLAGVPRRGAAQMSRCGAAPEQHRHIGAGRRIKRGCALLCRPTRLTRAPARRARRSAVSEPPPGPPAGTEEAPAGFKPNEVTFTDIVSLWVTNIMQTCATHRMHARDAAQCATRARDASAALRLGCFPDCAALNALCRSCAGTATRRPLTARRWLRACWTTWCAAGGARLRPFARAADTATMTGWSPAVSGAV